MVRFQQIKNHTLFPSLVRRGNKKGWFYLCLKNKTLTSSLAGILSLFIIFIILNMLFPFRADIDYSQLILSRDGRVIGAFLNDDDKWRFKADLEDISPNLKKSILFKEDKYFYYHPGINPVSIVRALYQNITKGGKFSGASTITMQIARLLEPKDRTYLNKLIEMFRALQLEFHYSKDELFEIYLNMLPYGGNIEGCRAASYFYFGVSTDKLSLAQSVALCVIPNDPNSLRPGVFNERITSERDKWLKILSNADVYTQKEIHYALNEKLNAYRRTTPKTAPHLCFRLNRKYPDKPVIKSGIDYNIQNETADIVSNYMYNMREKGIFNASVIIVDNKNNEALAYIGSNDFKDERHSGQVDGIKSVRSPGSTLKPLIYAMGFDSGIITPKRKLLDVPLTGEYAPENFDGAFHGRVTAEEALIRSLNVPAVRLLREVGFENFINKLEQAGFQSIRENSKSLGLSVILGGCGAALEELTKLYSCLANSGKLRNLKYINFDKSKEKQILSAESAYMISEILSAAERPDLPQGYLSAVNVPKIAWKTGTSYGRHDAWCIGYNPYYTVGVWTGNFSGAANARLTGADIAAPLLFEIFRNLGGGEDDWFEKPENLKMREVDEESGLLPGQYTEKTIDDFYIPLVSHTRTSQSHEKIYVSADESVSYCLNCLPDGNYKHKIYPSLNPELIAYYEAHNIPFEKAPPHNPNCPGIRKDNPPVISHPIANQEYYLDKDENQRIMLECRAAGDTREIYWYINDRFYKKSSPSESQFYTPEDPGIVKISCSDDKGRNSDINIKVVFY